MATEDETQERSSFERAEEFVDFAERKLVDLSRRGVAVAVEAAEDIWAEARALRRERTTKS